MGRISGRTQGVSSSTERWRLLLPANADLSLRVFAFLAAANPVRLTAKQLAELADAVSPFDLTDNLTTSISIALANYGRAKRDARDFSRLDLRRRLLARSKAARDLAALVRGADGFMPDEDLAAMLDARCAEWDQGAAALARSGGKPIDSAAIHLGLLVSHGLDAAGIPLTLGRNTEFVEVLRLTRRWADDVAGGKPRSRSNAYAFARTILTKRQASQAPTPEGVRRLSRALEAARARSVQRTRAE